MSNRVYPTLPGLMLPQGRSVVPPKVHVRTTPSQREFRSRDSLLPRYQYSLAYEFLRARHYSDEMAQLVGFYNAVGGPLDSWLYLDPDDHTIAAQPFGVGDGSTRAWQLLRGFGGFAEPVYDLATTPLISIDGQPCNLVMNSSFEAQAGNNQPYGFTAYNNAAVSTTFLAGAGRTGGLAFGLRANAATTSTFGLVGGADINESGSIKGGLRGKWQPNTAYVLTWYARKVNGSAMGVMSLGWDVGPASSSTLANPVLTTGWQRYAFAIVTGSTVEPGYSDSGFFINASSGVIAAGDEIHIDDLQITVGTAVQTYVAGDQSYTMNNGNVTFDQAPAAGKSLTWWGDYYRRCRFLGDRLDTEKFMAGLFAAKRVEFISVKG